MRIYQDALTNYLYVMFDNNLVACMHEDKRLYFFRQPSLPKFWIYIGDL